MTSKLFLASFIYGTCMLFSKSFVYTFRDILYYFKRVPKKAIKSGNPIEEHLRKLIEIVSAPEKAEKFLQRFYFATSIFFIGSLALFWKLFKLKAFVLAIVIGALPYLWLRLKLSVVQRTGSFEGEALIRELNTQYKLNYKNIREAIKATVVNLDDKASLSKRALFKLALRLNTYSGEEELNEILEEFRFTYGTEWANMLTHNFYNAIVDNSDVSAGLADLLNICKEINQKIEKEKQSRTQTVAMTKFLSPALFIIFYVMAAKMLSVKEIIRIQFTTQIGVLMLLLIIGSFLLNLAVSILASKPKFDI